MSYILDAIRKSDWERRRGQVPGVLDRHAAASPAADGAAGRAGDWAAPGWLRPLLLVVAGGSVAGGIAVAAVSLAPQLRPQVGYEGGAAAARTMPAAPLAQSTQPQSPQPMSAPRAVPAPAEAVASAPPPAPVAQSAPMVVVPPGTGWALLPMVPAGAVNAPGAAGLPMAMVPAAAEWSGGTAANVDLTDEEVAALLDSHGAPRTSNKPVADKRSNATGNAIGTKADAAPRRTPAADRGDDLNWVADARADLAAMAAAERAKARGLGAGLGSVAPTFAAQSSALAARTPASSPTSGARARPAAAAPIDELPQTVRDALPAISLSVHIYADEPSMRRVRVNNISVHEGDTVAAGLDVAAITRDGVIFRFKGSEFFLPANDNWQPRSAAAVR